MAHKSLQFSVVVPVFNRPRLLFKLLESLTRQKLSKSKFEVIVVDDGSTEKEVSVILRGSFAKTLNLKVIKQKNQGPARAREAGAARAYAEWVAYIDSDCYAAEDWLSGYADELANLGDLEQVGAIEGQTIAGLPPNPTEAVLENAIPRGAFTHETENTTGGKFPTCNMLVRKELCHFYPGYKREHYFREDTDLAFAILESGYTIPFSKKATVYHPSLPGSKTTPIRLALRYLYDPMLKRRFPGRYKTVDAHTIGGVTISHLRKKIYATYCFGLLTTLVLAVTSIGVVGLPLWPLALLVTLAGWLGTVYMHARGGKASLTDLFTIGGLSLVVPWILFYSLFKGTMRYGRVARFKVGDFLAGYKAGK